MSCVTVQKLEFSPIGNEGSFLQTPFWGLFKSRHGWKLIRARASFGAEENRSKAKEGAAKENALKAQEADGFDFSILVRSFARGFFSLAYVPLFPNEKAFKFLQAKEGGVANGSASANEGGLSGFAAAPSPETFCAALDQLAAELKALLPSNTICVRFDPQVEFPEPDERDAFNQSVKAAAKKGRFLCEKNAVDIQPPDTTQVDLTRTEEEILAGMKNKWRYNVNLAKRKGVQIQKISGNNLNLSDFVDIFYDLYKETSARDGIAMHAKAYYKDLLELSAQEAQKGSDVPQVNLYVASHEGDNLGAIMTLFSKTESVYLYGCSSNKKRNLMPNFLLQWTAMSDAKAYGSRYYDMYGMPPTDDPSHPMHGLYLFKTGFGGRNVHRAGSYDVPLKGIYKLCVLAEGARAFWHKKILKKIRGR
ncbi:MAG: peptidoglycan bridge formation glycyltransferase FemA/FemB family protein [Treponema sp.]|nr:peptidoglycan bridge formation glycyltransferase FemA/FemB family protein [Treponema sp.]MEE3434603.1 peptidoglycan bridge formation glycyltransferase FemA/FemB family protein [Treponema sp.]